MVDDRWVVVRLNRGVLAVAKPQIQALLVVLDNLLLCMVVTENLANIKKNLLYLLNFLSFFEFLALECAKIYGKLLNFARMNFNRDLFNEYATHANANTHVSKRAECREKSIPRLPSRLESLSGPTTSEFIPDGNF